jgi:putative oxidoreductase
MSSDTVRASAALLGRLLLAALFILEGWSKVRGYAPAAAYMEHFSVAGSLLPLVIALELGGGVLLAIGWQTRLAAVALAIFCVVATLLFHMNLANRNEVLHFEKDLAIAGGLLALFAFGAGRYSVDAMRQS